MATLSYGFKADAGDLLFPRGTKVMAFGADVGYQDPVDVLLSTHADQLAQMPDVGSAPVRGTRAGSFSTVADLGESEDAYKRPNGEYYHARNVKAGTVSLKDVPLVQKCHAEKIPVLFYGPPGTGKTALAEAALPDVITVPGTGDTERADFEGGYVQNPDGTFTWVDGPLVTAMEEGRPLLIDEIALIDSKVMATVYSVMDGRGELTITANPARGTVKAKEGFAVYGACNPDVPGAVMSEALLSRFLLHIEVLTDFDLAIKLGVPREIVVVAKNLTRKKDTGDVLKAPQMRELLAFRKIAETFGLEPALANFISIAEPSDRPTYKEAIKSAFAKDISALMIG